MGACLNLVDRRILNLAINARNAMPKGGRKRLVGLEIREFKVMVADLSHTEMSEGNVMASPNGSHAGWQPSGFFGCSSTCTAAMNLTGNGAWR